MILGKIIIGILSLFTSGYDENIKFIKDHNSKNLSFQVEENQFIHSDYDKVI